MPIEIIPERRLDFHPDGETVRKVDKFAAHYHLISPWRDRTCGGCAWFKPTRTSAVPDLEEGIEHPAGDMKGEVHRCGLVSEGIAAGAWCPFWGTLALARDMGD